MTEPPEVSLIGLSIADPPERWAALGFDVRDGEIAVGAVTLTLGIAPPGEGIVGWALAGRVSDGGDLDGLPTRWVSPGSGRGRPAGSAGEGVDAGAGIAAIDHVVVVTPRFDALAAELHDLGLGLRRIAEIRGTRMGFRRLGTPILEVVEATQAAETALWGVTFAMDSADGLDALCARSRLVGEPRPAIQAGRRIATVARAAGLSTQVAFIDPG